MVLEIPERTDLITMKPVGKPLVASYQALEIERCVSLLHLVEKDLAVIRKRCLYRHHAGIETLLEVFSQRFFEAAQSSDRFACELLQILDVVQSPGLDEPVELVGQHE